MPFSQLLIIYPDGVAQKATFETLDLRFWKSRHEEHLQQKHKMKLATYCFLCDELMTSFKDLDCHVRDGRHAKNVREFKRTLPPDAPKPTPMEVERPMDQGGY